MFWKIGWRIFGKRFLNYMGGFKHHVETVLKMASRGKFEPTSSEINFAVPDVHVLKDFKPYDHSQESTPGIFRDTINQMSKFLENKSACITFDGKKIKQ
ncbi:hypothetical protein DPMN_064369 [Dreissena polymorpha]|uniref:Uncharacterized protein n=1 Tax=Dreissena polymorpha TaxID=45954 RepID=A0A9D4HJE5_DREPO|nr:hypothetical protein DPMN_064369 [Dreissena polymorpha]